MRRLAENGWLDNESCTRHRCVASADQRRRHDTDAHRGSARRGGSYGAASCRRTSIGRCPARLIPRFGSRSCRGGGLRAASRNSRPTRFTLRRKGRSGWPRAAAARLTTSPSRPPTTRNFRNTCASARRSRKAGRMPFCAAITGARGARSLQRSTCAASSSLTASRTSSFGREAWIPACSSPAAASICRDLARSGSMRAASQSRRTSTLFWRWTYPAEGRRRRRTGSRRARGALSEARFVGYKFGADLARHLSSADVFVFPSRTDTFGLVMLEAIACGTPVAAYPVTGPIDVIAAGVSGVLDEDLRQAALAALKLDREGCRRSASSGAPGNGRPLQFLSRTSCGRVMGATSPQSAWTRSVERASTSRLELGADAVRRLAQQPGVAREVAMKRDPS